MSLPTWGIYPFVGLSLQSSLRLGLLQTESPNTLPPLWHLKTWLLRDWPIMLRIWLHCWRPEKPNLSDRSNFIHYGDSSIIPIPTSSALEASSTYTCHGRIEILQIPGPSSIVRVNLDTKSANIFPLMAFLSLYLTSKDLSLVFHLAILPLKLDPCNKAYRGCLVKAYTMWD